MRFTFLLFVFSITCQAQFMVVDSTVTWSKIYDTKTSVKDLAKSLQNKAHFDLTIKNGNLQFIHNFKAEDLSSPELKMSNDGTIYGFISVKNNDYNVIIENILINKVIVTRNADIINKIDQDDLSIHVLKDNNIMPELRESMILYHKYFHKLFDIKKREY